MKYMTDYKLKKTLKAIATKLLLKHYDNKETVLDEGEYKNIIKLSNLKKLIQPNVF